MWLQIGMAAAGAYASWSQASKAKRRAEKQFDIERRRIELLMQQSKAGVSKELSDLSRFTRGLKVEKSQRDEFMEQAILAGGRRAAAAEGERQQAAAGIGGAARLRTGSAVAEAQAQGLLAVESSRIQREQELNKLISQNLAQAAEISQRGFQIEQNTKTQLMAARANLAAQQAEAEAQQSGAITSGLTGMAMAALSAKPTTTDSDIDFDWKPSRALGSFEAVNPFSAPDMETMGGWKWGSGGWQSGLGTHISGGMSGSGSGGYRTGGSNWWNPTSWDLSWLSPSSFFPGGK